MAQHYKIISFVNEPWFGDVINEIKEALKKPEELEKLSDDYKMHHLDYTVYLFQSKNDSILEDWGGNNMAVSQCHFEIHLDRDDRILEIYVPL